MLDTHASIFHRPARHRPLRLGERDAAVSASIDTQIEAHDTSVRDETALLTRLRSIVQSLAQSAPRHTTLGDARISRILAEQLPLSADIGFFSGSDLLETARLIVLTNLYADYLPSNRWRHLDLDATDCHGWVAPDGGLVVDVVTTIRMTELDEAADQYTLFDATRRANQNSALTLGGLRHIVLDAPHESTWRPAHGEPQPLYACDTSDLPTTESTAVGTTLISVTGLNAVGGGPL